MHTWQQGGTTFVGNADLSGDVAVTDGRSGASVTIPADDLLAFVAQFVRSSKITVAESGGADADEIGRLEDQDDAAILGIDGSPRIGTGSDGTVPA